MVINKIACTFQFFLKINDKVKPSLAFFRMSFGLLMFMSTLRFMLKGWINEFYIAPKFHFTYFGFDFIKPCSEIGMYVVFSILLMSCLFITVGLFYRVATILFFICFTYIELIDKTFYLNHYYFVSLIGFLIIFLPLNCYASMDLKYNLIKNKPIQNWHLWILRLQVGLVYFFAGIAKLKYEWLFEAQPLKIWLATFSHLPVIGSLLELSWVAYVGAWFGALFDLCIPFVLLSNNYRKYGYALVIIFHLLTFYLFNIGMFPFIMILSAMIFFSPLMHQKIITMFFNPHNKYNDYPLKPILKKNIAVTSLLTLFFIFQCVMPFRYLFYKGNSFYHEQGFRFSWNVMLMEKNGFCEFLIKNKKNKKEFVFNTYSVLTLQQNKMMSTQPDMILQFAHYINELELKKGNTVSVYADCYVSVNGKPSRKLINPDIDLLQEKEGFCNKNWIYTK